MDSVWRVLFAALSISLEVLCKEQSLELVANDTLQLKCEGSGKLTWNFEPDFLVENFKDLNQSVEQNENQDHRGRAMWLSNPSRTILKMDSVQANDTGAYICMEDGEVKSKTDVYVFDGDLCTDIIVPPHPYESIIRVEVGMDVYIPCRTTKPNIKLVLSDYDENKLDYPYIPMKGFLMKNITIHNQGSHIFCEALIEECKDRSLPYPYQMFEICVFGTGDTTTISIVGEKPKEAFQGDIVEITCKYTTIKYGRMSLGWFDPNNNTISSEIDHMGKFGIQATTENAQIITLISTLIIKNVTRLDEGVYRCQHQQSEIETSVQLKVKEAKKAISLSVEERANVLVMNESQLTSKDFIQWVVTYHPRNVNFTWLNPKGIQINNTKKHETKPNGRTQQLFRIYKPSLSDVGVYTIKGQMADNSAELKLELVINSKPQVTIEGKLSFYKPNVHYELQCVTSGYPKEHNITSWVFECMERSRHIKCRENFGIQNKTANSTKVAVVTETTGRLTCKACNLMGCNSSSTLMILSEHDPAESITADIQKAYEGDKFLIKCVVPRYPCDRTWNWFYKKNETQEFQLLNTGTGTNRTLSSKCGNYSCYGNLSFHYANLRDNGIYQCKAICANKSDIDITLSYALTVYKLIQPQFITLENKNSTSVLEGSPANFDCDVRADPPPTIHWTHNGEPFEKKNATHIRYKLSPGNTTLLFASVLSEDEGSYTCRVRDRNNNIKLERHFSLFVKSKKWSPVVLIPIIIILIILIAVVIYLWRAVKKEQKKVQRLTAHDVKLFLEGATENIDMNVALDQQADLLPYNPNYEYPREHLKLGRQLGSGAYGRVVRGEASAPLFGATSDYEASPDEQDMQGPTIVAVKMLKANADMLHIKALMTELKILIHVGKHLNVVNLLGACTTNLCNKELLVIVEYCKYGNLHTYLHRQRDNFIDQVDHLKDTLDFSIGSDDGEGHYENHSVILEQKQVLFKKETRTIIYDPLPDADRHHDRYHGEATSTTDGSSNTEHWTTKYRSDFKGELKKISTKDLVCWSYQVARGMKYLASRRIVHADLAARNLLLADNNVVKICDFGLARNLYNEANYLKKGDSPMPIKWMAIESIQDRIFSAESDVWSFGIVLWEFFTLAKTPYPGIPLDEHFLARLNEGYRMEKPQYATSEIYKIMRKCWDKNVSRRPQFGDLVNQLGQILDDNVKQFYLELSGPYVRMNSLHSEYVQELPATALQEPAAHKSSSAYIGMQPSAVTNPSYMMLQQADIQKDYVNVNQRESEMSEVGKLAVQEPEGYLKMSPVVPKGESPSFFESRESSVNL